LTPGGSHISQMTQDGSHMAGRDICQT